MRGIVFCLLEEAVVASHGASAWDRCLLAGGVTGEYRWSESYEDEELFVLVDAASAHLGMAASDLLRWFGRCAVLALADRHGPTFRRNGTAAAMLQSPSDLVSAELTAIGGPDLSAPMATPCMLVEGLIEGVAAHYGEEAIVGQTTCRLRGDARCGLDWRFVPAPVVTSG